MSKGTQDIQLPDHTVSLHSDVVMVKAELLQEHPENPRLGNEDILEESIREHGFYGSLVVQKSTGYILIGNHRFRVGRNAFSMPEFPVVYLDIPDEQAKKILLMDNRSSDFGDYDEHVLLKLIQEIAEEGVGHLVGSGYTENDLQDLINKLATDGIDELVEGFDHDEDESSATSKTIPSLKFGKYIIPLTQEENSILEKRLIDYSNMTGSYYGFIRSILHVS